MKKILSLFISILILFSTTSVFAEDIQRFYVVQEGASGYSFPIGIGESKDINFVFKPEGFIGNVSLDSSDSHDSNVADIKINSTYCTVTGKGVGTTTFVLYCPMEPVAMTATLTVTVVDDSLDPIKLTTSESKIDWVLSSTNSNSYTFSINLTPESAYRRLIYFSDDTSIATITQNYRQDYFTVNFIKAGKTNIHIKAGNEEIVIPVNVKENTTENYPEAVLPPTISKSTIKSAYEKYLKKYNTTVNNDKYDPFTSSLDEVESKNNSLLTSANLKKAENIHNFYRTITGLPTVTYSSSLSTLAQPGADYMFKTKEFGHDVADGKDTAASNALHSGNIYRGTYTITDVLKGFMNEINNRAGIYNTGHRAWMLDSYISNWGLAQNEDYWVQYYDLKTLDTTKSAISAFPSSGYFPIEALENTRTKWSLQLGYPYNPYSTSTIKVFVTDQKGNEVELSNYQTNPNDPNGCYLMEVGYGNCATITFWPKKFVDTDTNGDLTKLIGKSFTIRVEGLQIKQSVGSSYTTCKPLEYTVNLMSMYEEKWMPQATSDLVTSFSVIDQSTNKELGSTINIKVGESVTLKANVTPSAYQSDISLSCSVNSDYENFFYSLRTERVNGDRSTLRLNGLREATLSTEIVISELNYRKPVTIIISNANNDTSSGNGGSGNTGSGSTDTESGNNGSQTTNEMKVYRLYNKVSGEHLYTTDTNEVNVLNNMPDWKAEGVAWSSPTTGGDVFRLYSPVTGNHLYTGDSNEINVLSTQRGWSIDNNNKPMFYSGGNTPIYRLYNESLKQHLLTTDYNEYSVLVDLGWRQEGIALYALKIR